MDQLPQALPKCLDDELTSAHQRYGQLKWAITHRQRELVESLLQQGVPVNDPSHGVYDLRSPLHSAVYLGDLGIVKKLLARGASVNVFNCNNETPLMIDAKLEKNGVVDLLLSARDLKNCHNKQNLTHLHIACMRNRVDVLEKLMKAKTDINDSISLDSLYWPGFTPLHIAVRFRCIETVEFLLNTGANITIKDAQQLTPLHLADMIRDEQIMDMILSTHREVLANPVNSEGLSHFHIACTRNNPEIVGWFIRNRVSVQDRIPDSSSTWPCKTAIDLAIYYECVDVVKLLLLEGSQVQSSVGLKYDRIRSAQCTGNEKLVNLLVQKDELMSSKTHSIEIETELHCACMNNDFQRIKDSLSNSPSELNSLNCWGHTPLHIAIMYSSNEIIKYLCDQGANYNITNASGKTPLHIAFEYGSIEIMESILDDYAKINENPVDNDGLSHFHIACSVNHVGAVERFLELGADVNGSVNSNSTFWPGFTPLHFAAKFGSVEVVHILLNNEARYSITDQFGSTAFDIAESRECPRAFEVMEAILSCHSLLQDVSFDDCGYSLLHIWSGNSYISLSSMEDFVRHNPSHLNKVVKKLGSVWDGVTPLHCALKWGEWLRAKYLVDSGADIHIKDANGDTPVHLALDYPWEHDHLSLDLKSLIGCSQNLEGSEGHTLFHVACAAGNIELIKYYLSIGVDPNLPTKIQGYNIDDKTPLHLVVEMSSPNLEAVELLLGNGANPRARDSRRNTPLHLLRGNSKSEVIRLLSLYGADLNARNAISETPLLSLCKNCSSVNEKQLSSNIFYLIELGADINAMDEENVTALSSSIWKQPRLYNSSIYILLRHVFSLLLIHHDISDVVKKDYIKMRNTPGANHFNENDVHLKKCMNKELEYMGQIYTDQYTSLRDILFKNSNELALLCENSVLEKIFYSDDHYNNYPSYGGILKMQIEKGRIRRPLLMKSKDILNDITGIIFPDAWRRIQRTFLDAI